MTRPWRIGRGTLSLKTPSIRTAGRKWTSILCRSPALATVVFGPASWDTCVKSVPLNSAPTLASAKKADAEDTQRGSAEGCGFGDAFLTLYLQII
jgi:hypothetical protein